MLDHLSLGVSDLARAIAFYDALFVSLGHVRLWTNDKGAGYGPRGHDEPFAIFAVGEQARAAGAGTHCAFTALSREAVEEFHHAALRMGGHDEGAPGVRAHYGGGYFAAFVRDPDGNKLEVVFHE